MWLLEQRQSNGPSQGTGAGAIPGGHINSDIDGHPDLLEVGIGVFENIRLIARTAVLDSVVTIFTMSLCQVGRYTGGIIQDTCASPIRERRAQPVHGKAGVITNASIVGVASGVTSDHH
jgi:hypothetical protein